MGSFDSAENDKALESIFQIPQRNPKEELLSLLEKMNQEEIAKLLSLAKQYNPIWI